MVELEIPVGAFVVGVVEENGGRVRQEKVLGEKIQMPHSGDAVIDRKAVDEAVLTGEIERFPVGEKIILKRTDSGNGG